MKQYRIFWALLFVLLLVTTAVSADNIYTNCNSNFYLEYGSGYTECKDTLSAHSYRTVGRTDGTPNARVAVYIEDEYGNVKAYDVSKGVNDTAEAWWTQRVTTKHKHRAASHIIW